MVTWRDARTDEDASHALLTEYFALRAAEFPAEAGEYRTVFPEPERFVPPAGVFLVVEDEDLAGEAADVGCGGVRRIADAEDGSIRFEVKHLYLQPHTRGRGLGRALLVELELRSRELGATHMVLDTRETQVAAVALYRASGYRDIPAYNDNANASLWLHKILA